MHRIICERGLKLMSTKGLERYIKRKGTPHTFSYAYV
jgi:hypothetical protein